MTTQSSQGHSPAPTGSLARLARAAASHPWRTIAAWLVIIVTVIACSNMFGGELSNTATIPGSEAQKATDLLQERFPARAGDTAQIVFQSDKGLAGSQAKADVRAAAEAASHVPGVTAVGDPYAGKGGAISKDGHIGFAEVQFDTPASEVEQSQIDALQDDVRAAVDDPNMRVEFGGTVMTSTMVDSHTSELLGLAAAVIVLLVVLGAAAAMAVPITLALISVGVGMSALTLLASLTTFHKITPILATMIGLGVAIDYTLFILMRFRQGLADGLSPVDASVTAVATAGRAVIFAGLTVAISISGLFLIGIPFVTKMGLGTALAVIVSVLLAISLLPAVLAKVGHRVNAGRIPFLPADAGSDAVHAGAAARFGRAVTRRPKLAAAAVLVILGVVAIPAASIQLGTADAGTNPPEMTTRKAYDMMAAGFGAGVNGPLLVAVDQQNDPGAANRLAAAFQQTPGVAAVLPPVVNDSGDTAQVVVYPTTSPQSSETSDLVSSFRDEVVPTALEGSGAQAYVGGPTAANEDLATMMIDRFPLFLLFVVGTTFLLLTMAFRSVVIAVKAALTTLLSAAAAFGVLVAVFEWGWGINLIGLDNTGPTASYLPVIVLSILFGLSMDYEVFLASRIREEYVATGDARTAITDGVGAVGRVIVAAALIMGAVFWAFVLTDDRTVKSFGVGLGVAILVDALLVRMVLVPAIMQMLGDRAWYMPRWLDRLLPNLTIEPAAEPAVVEAEPELELPRAA